MDPSLDWTAYRAFEIYRIIHWCSSTLIVFDWAVTVNKERKFFWRNFKLNWASFAYILNRYFALLVWAPVSVIYLTKNFTEEECSRSYKLLSCVFIIVLLASSAVLIIRCGAIWDNNLFVLTPLLFLLAVALIISFYFTSRNRMSWIPGVSQCSSIADPAFPSSGWIGYLVPTIIETACVVLVLWKLHEYKSTGGNTVLLHRLTRDSLVYYILVATINIGAIIFYARDSNYGFSAAFSIPTVAVTSICCSRMVLDLREDSARGELTGMLDSSHTYSYRAKNVIQKVISSLKRREDGSRFEPESPTPLVFPATEMHHVRAQDDKRKMAKRDLESGTSAETDVSLRQVL